MKFAAVQLLLASMLLGRAAHASEPAPDAGAQAPTPPARQLLRLVFPVGVMEKPEAGSGPSLRTILPKSRWPWLGQGANASQAVAGHVEAIRALRLDDTHVALVTHDTPVDDCGSYGCPTALGAYFFALDDKRWRLATRVDRADYLGAGGLLAARITVTPWPGHGLVMAIPAEDDIQGHAWASVNFLGLLPDRLSFAFNAQTSADNQTGYGIQVGDERSPRDFACPEVLAPAFKAPPGPVSTRNENGCQRWHARWRIEDDALLFDFDWVRRRVEDARLQPIQRWKTHARLEWRDDKLKVVAGRLPSEIP